MSQLLFETIKQAISESATATVVPNDSFRDHDDLLLLDWRSDIAGFALVGETAKPSYEKAYLHFKTLYRDNKNAWDKRSLSFVLCRLDHSLEKDSFFSLVESDPYFCRKYVIRYSNDPATFVKEIGRLPFLPLPRVGDSSFVRPPSAKQVLQALEFPSNFTRALVEPRKRSAKSLAEDVKKNALIIPSVQTTDIKSIGKLAMVETARRTRVKSLSVEAFRAYRNIESFDLSAPITVLYGQNGLGKTSLFDAIDFACTGRIGRLFRHQRSPEEFADLATHLDRDAAKANVRIELACSEGDNEVTENAQRSVTDWNYAWIGKTRYDRRAFLQHLSGVSSVEGESSLDVKQLESLFRATHLFGQDDQELLLQFRQKSVIPNDLFSRMLALDDYTEAINKTDALEKELKKWSQETENKVNELRVVLSEAETAQHGLQKKLSEDTASEAVSDLCIEIRELAASLGITTSISPSDSESAKELISIIKKERESLDERKGAIVDLNRSQNTLVSEIASGKADSEELERVRKQLVENANIQRELRKKQEELQSQLENEEKELNKLDHNLDSLSKCRKVEERIAEITAKSEESKKQLDIVELSLKNSQDAAKTVGIHLQDIVTRFLECKDRLRVLREKSTAAATGIMQLTELGSLYSREKEITQNLKGNAAELQSSQAEQKTLQEQNEKLRTAVTKISVLYAGATAQGEELSNLLDSLERFVADCECPACGADFDSNESVIAAINARKGIRSEEINKLSVALNEARTELEQNTESLRKSEARYATFEQNARELHRQLSDTAARKNAIEVEIGKFVSAVELDEAASLLTKEIEEIKRQELAFEKEMVALETKKTDAEKEQNELREIIENQEVELVRGRKSLQELKVMLNESSNELSRQLSSLDWREGDQQTPSELEIVIRNSRESLKGNIKKTTDSIAFLNADLYALIEREKTYQALQKPLDERMKQRDHFFNRVRGLCTKVRIEYPPTETKCKEVEDELRKSEITVELLIGKLNRLIAALDIAEIRQTFDEGAKKVEALGKELKELEEQWRVSLTNLKGAKKLESILSNYRKSAFSDHIDTYGPLISVLQQRLRSVFGFSNISLNPVEDGILVRVGWRDRQVKPVDYFSDSQKQILALSVFLGSCLRQNWSGFTPILLDDPITHFDDFNAHAFVEMVRGLIATEPERWQFVISTCEERLYSLMRRKFTGMTKANFYHFKGMESNGPIVELE